MLEDSLLNGEEAADIDTDEDMLEDGDWRRMFKEALSASVTFQQNKLRPQWTRNYRAYSNRHMQGSKYELPRYRSRSKLFKPKTRAAVRKNDATAASALFSTEDVVSITPERASDRVQQMTARFVHEALNYRLDREGPFTGPSWFMTAIGARQDAQITGVCVSKQYWQFEEREVEILVDETVLDEVGLPVLDEATGEPMVETRVEIETERVRDRLMIDLIPAELAYIDPTGDWRNPIQDGGTFICAHPVRKEDLEHMIDAEASRPKLGGSKWRSDLDIDAIIDRGRGGEMRNSEAVRRSRDEGIDRYESRHADERGETIWLYEVFYKYGGTDWHFWMLGETVLLSDPAPVEESYPAHKGRRPYVVGFGALEPHKVYPTAPVTTWQPLQMEQNDITNLRLDALKMAITPITKVKRGRNIDWKAVQNRGPDATMMVDDVDDVTFDRAPTPPSSTQLDLNNLNVDLDELAGVFSPASVQTNRQLNETATGMNLIAGNSNALTEFDLRVWVETWVEPVLHQAAILIQYYETAETVIAVAGEKAGLLSNMQDGGAEAAMDDQAQQDRGQGMAPVSLQQVMAQLDTTPLMIRVNVGIGAMDSRQKLEKFMAGMKMTMESLPILAADGIQPNGREMVQEAWGLLGYKDASRFFKKADEQKKGPPPEVQREMLKIKADAQKTQAGHQHAERIEAMKAQIAQMEQAAEAQQHDREMSLKEREFMHEQRMDMFDGQLRAMQAQLSDMANQMGAQRGAMPDRR